VSLFHKIKWLFENFVRVRQENLGRRACEGIYGWIRRFYFWFMTYLDFNLNHIYTSVTQVLTSMYALFKYVWYYISRW